MNDNLIFNTGALCHRKSNHPPCIIKTNPKSINKRLSEISIDEHSFNQGAPLDQKALDDSGYNNHLTFTPHLTQSPELHQNKPPPKHHLVQSNLQKECGYKCWAYVPQILDEEFPQNHLFHKIFNQNTVKISYSCMPNLKQKINGSNKLILQKMTAPSVLKACNCRGLADCPMTGDCLKSFMVYQATVTTEDSRSAQTYVGLTETSSKARFANHKSSFNDPSKRLSTELSKHVWNLKEANMKFKITWKILKQTSPFSTVSNRCNLCLWEKYFWSIYFFCFPLN